MFTFGPEANMKASAAPLANAVAKARSRARSALGRAAIRAFARDDLAVRALERRAVEAAIWGMPAVNFDAMLQAAVRAGAGDNHIVCWSRPCDWRNQTLTPNTDALYSMPFFNTKDVGPMVLEIPPKGDGADQGAIIGSVMDCWQAALEDVGPAGLDKGQGGRYLILPPGWQGTVPDGFFPLRSRNYRGYALLRSIPKAGSDADIAAAAAYARRIQLYPLSATGTPQTKRVDVTGMLFDATLSYDQRFFASLNRIVQGEPWLERDRVMIDVLKSIGIEKGQAFAPSADAIATLTLGAGEAHAWLTQRFESTYPGFYSGGDSDDAPARWFFPADEELAKSVAAYFERQDAYPIDARATACYCAFSSIRHLGADQFYLFTTRDGRGASLDGGKSYRLVVPADVPVTHYWSATAYDFTTHALLRDVPWGSRSSLTPGLATNLDGSTDLYFGPKAPSGKESNWVPTKPGVRFEVLFRFYGPEKALFDRRWRLPDLEPGGGVGSWLGVPRATLSPAEAKAIARESYLFALPLVYQSIQTDVVTNVPSAEGARGAPVNQFAHHRTFPDPSNRTVVAWNVDTLYSIAALDLTIEPMVLSVPPMGDRWWLMQILDFWNDVPAALATRTVGNGGGHFALCGPHFRGALPAGLREVRVDTSLCALGGRTYTAGPGDLAAVHAIQDRYKLTPLSRWGTDYAPPAVVSVKPGVDARTPIGAQTFAIPTEHYFTRVATLLVDNPPREADASIVARMARLGVARGGRFSFAGLAPEVQSAIEAGVAEAKAAIVEGESKLGRERGGWTMALDTGRYGTNYLNRAAWTYFAVGANLPEDAVYPHTTKDADGHPLDATCAYVLHFERRALPPAAEFWSLTIYDEAGYLVPNVINRASVGDRSHLVYEPDGSLTIYIQADPPVGKEANWLPTAAEGPFKLYLRLYGPRQEVLDGNWWPPPVQRLQRRC
jgi:hypothetical protein